MHILRMLKRWQAATIGGLVLCGALLSPHAAESQQVSHSKQSIESRIQHLEDIEEIRILLTNYGRFLDAHDLVAYSNLFAKDGEWVGGFGTGKGPAGVLALMEKNLPPPNPASKPGSSYHLLTNFEIDVHGDTATAWSRWTYTVTGADNKPSMMYGGHYDDALVREDGRWKFQRRVAANDIPHTDPPAPK
jgi:SnoaL-like domain